jgi:hypothetical protein
MSDFWLQIDEIRDPSRGGTDRTAKQLTGISKTRYYAPMHESPDHDDAHTFETIRSEADVVYRLMEQTQSDDADLVNILDGLYALLDNYEIAQKVGPDCAQKVHDRILRSAAYIRQLIPLLLKRKSVREEPSLN